MELPTAWASWVVEGMLGVGLKFCAVGLVIVKLLRAVDGMM